MKRSLTRRRVLFALYVAGPYIACGIVLWRMAEWELLMTRWVKHSERVMQAASADIAEKATELHEEAVTQGASQN